MHRFRSALACGLATLSTLLAPSLARAAEPAPIDVDALAAQVAIGDVVFIRVPAALFRRVADATGSWTNHVGIVIDVRGGEPIVAESRFPLSGETTLERFVARSEAGRVEVMRLDQPIGKDAQARLQVAARARERVFYDTGFDLHSPRQFCSRFVREVVLDATGVPLGDVETFATLLARRPDADVVFWRRWYFGHIPWARETVTPASILASPHLRPVFDGRAAPSSPRRAGGQANTSDT